MTLQIWFMKLKKYCIQKDFESQYTTICKLGQGSYSSVYRVKNKNNSYVFACKIIEKNLKNTEKDQKKTKAEVISLCENKKKN